MKKAENISIDYKLNNLKSKKMINLKKNLKLNNNINLTQHDATL